MATFNKNRRQNLYPNLSEPFDGDRLAKDVQKVLDRCPLLFDDKHIQVEKNFIDEEPDETEYNKCTIEVTGMKQVTNKNRMMLYFESKKGADEDVLSIVYVDERDMYLVRFISEYVVDAVLKKKHVLDGSELQVRKHIPLPPETTYPKQVSVSGMDTKVTEEVFIHFMEARSKVDVDKVIYGDIEGTAIVIFKTQPDVIKLKEECKKKQLHGRYVKVNSVPLTKCIIVSSLKDGIPADAVMYYFDDKKFSGVEGVDDVELDSKNKTCIVYFIDSDAPVAACKREHTIEGCKVKVDLYYEVLGGIGIRDGPKFRPDPIDLVYDVKKIQFLTNSKTGKNELEQQLKNCHGLIRKWPERKTGTLRIECTITADMKDRKTLVKTWETDVNKAVDKIVSNLQKEEYQTLQEEWKPVMEKVRGVNLSKPDLVVLSVESSQCEMCVVGYKQQVAELSRQLKSIITEVKADLERKKHQVKEKIPLKYRANTSYTSDPAVESVRDMGYSNDLIQRAISIIRQNNSGKERIEATEILEVIFTIADDDNSERNAAVPSDNRPMSTLNQPSQQVSQPNVSNLPVSMQSSAPSQGPGIAISQGQGIATSQSGNASESSLPSLSVSSLELGNADIRSLQEEIIQLKEQVMCKICMDKNVSIAFLPCGHLACCIDCAPAMRKCPLCRVYIKGTLKTYLA